MGSNDRQSAGAPTAERITGYSPPADGTFRLRAVLTSGPPPEGPLTLFSREIPLADIGGSAVSSLPTPGDAAGAIAVGAVNWRGDGFKAYSSQGPTDDGRLKPEIMAPTDTRLQGPNGLRSVGGTSIAAPNAAGAAAVMLAAARRAGGNPSAAEVRGQLTALAVNLGVPGPDTVFGYGRVRVNAEGPRLGAITPASLASVRGRVTVTFKARRPLEGHPVDPAPRRPPRRAPRPDLPQGHHRRHPAAARRLPRPLGPGEGLLRERRGQGLVDQGRQHPAAAGGALGAVRHARLRPGRAPPPPRAPRQAPGRACSSPWPTPARPGR